MRAGDLNEMATALCEFWRRTIFVFADATPEAQAWLMADENWQSLLVLFDQAAGELLGAMASSHHSEYRFTNTPAQIAAIQRSARKAIQNGYRFPEKVTIDLSHAETYGGRLG